MLVRGQRRGWDGGQRLLGLPGKKGAPSSVQGVTHAQPFLGTGRLSGWCLWDLISRDEDARPAVRVGCCSATAKAPLTVTLPRGFGTVLAFLLLFKRVNSFADCAVKIVVSPGLSPLVTDSWGGSL